MALKENKTLRSVELLIDSKTINVAWVKQITDGDVIVASTVIRSSYAEEDKNRFNEDLGKEAKKFNSLVW